MASSKPVRNDVSAKTPQAADDVANAGEDAVGPISIAQLLSNDLGGNAKRFYGVGQDHTVAATTAETAHGAVVSVAGGAIHYDPTGSAAIQALGAGQSLTDTFDYTIRLANGALSSAVVSVTVAGANDAATITGKATGAVEEDGALFASGKLAVTDTDTGEAVFQAPAAADLAKAYGAFAFDAVTGAWSYALDNDKAQALAAGQTVTETLTVASADGTATQPIAVTVSGADEAAVVLNGGFEDGLSGWNGIGTVATTDTATALGAASAQLSSDSVANDQEIESFLGLAGGTLDAIGGADATNGSAITQVVDLNAGETVTFSWRFQAGDYLPYDDFAFFSTGEGQVQKLAAVSGVGDHGDTGWQSASFTATVTGPHSIGFGVSNAQDTVGLSTLYVDDVFIS